MSLRDQLFLCALAVLAGGMAIAGIYILITERRRRRRSAWNRRYADVRFSPSADEVEKRYAEYQAPTYLRTRAEEERLLPPSLRRQPS